MADNNDGGGTTFLAFIVGALLVVVVGFFVFHGMPGGHSASPGASLTVNTGKSG
jgi:hypothetical protein